MHSPSPSRLRRALAGLAPLLALLAIAGCGSSSTSSPSTITVGNESSTLPPEETSTTASSAIKTPTSGPLSKEPTITPPTGAPPTKLVTKEIVTGSGPVAEKGASVTVNYVGALYKTGKVFDASWNRNEPFNFTLGAGNVIKGWEQGVVGMRVGGRRELIIPPELAYGKQGSGTTIPPNETLVFVVDLLGT
jgi:peptidylprolyl isomerase